MKTVSRLPLPDFRFVRWRTIFATWAACGQGLELGMQLPLVELYGEGTVRSLLTCEVAGGARVGVCGITFLRVGEPSGRCG